MSIENKISLIVPVYNVENYLPACIESMLKQTYSNIEIMLIDDGSTDNSPCICDEYAKKDSRIRVIHTENGGVSQARNIGIQKASGKYITCVDSDDEITPECIQVMYTSLIQNHADMSVCLNQRIDSDSKPVEPKKVQQSYRIEGKTRCMEEFLIGRDINSAPWGKLVRKELWNNITFPIGKYHEDVFTMYKLIAKCQTISVTNMTGYLYRIRQGSITQKNFSIKHLDTIEGSIQRYEYVLQNEPTLAKMAEALIVQSCLFCTMKLAESQNYDADILPMLQKTIKKHISSYMHGPNRPIAKVLAISLCVNIKLMVWIIRKLHIHL